jgi:hypothetical protein
MARQRQFFSRDEHLRVAVAFFGVLMDLNFKKSTFSPLPEDFET